MVTTLQPIRGALMTASRANRTQTPRPPHQAPQWQKLAVLALLRSSSAPTHPLRSNVST